MINALKMKNIMVFLLSFIFIFSIISVMFVDKSYGQAPPSSGETCELKSDLSVGKIRELIGDAKCNQLPGGCGDRTKGTPLPVSDGAGTPTDYGVLCAYSTFENIVSLIKFAILIISVIVFSYAGVLFATSQDDETKRSKAKGYIFSGVVGLALVLVAQIIPSLVTWAFG